MTQKEQLNKFIQDFEDIKSSTKSIEYKKWYYTQLMSTLERAFFIPVRRPNFYLFASDVDYEAFEFYKKVGAEKMQI